MSACIWKKDAKVKDLNLEVMRQALLKADQANLRTLAPYQAFPMYYDDPVPADDGNCDKASVSSAEDLPWELIRSVDGVTKQRDADNAQKLENRLPEKIESRSKRIRQETKQEKARESEAEEIQGTEKAEASNELDKQPSIDHCKSECIFSIEEWLAQ